jgi:cytochrome oxidase Cu insertion factor (SCO1/SenC/PrrC family)
MQTLLPAAVAAALAAPGAATAHDKEPHGSESAKEARPSKTQAPMHEPTGKETQAERDAKAREYFTDTVLVTQGGKKVRFFSDVLQGKTVVISFVYTNCGDACPLITHKLVQTRTQIPQLFGSSVRFVSISIDPDNDSPEALRKFAAKFDADHPEWLFLTGAKARVDHVLKKLGAYTEDVQSHSTAIIAGNVPVARWRKIRPDTPPQVIAETIRYLAEQSSDRRGQREGATRLAAERR